jgi:hypothetical protein
VRVRKWTEWSIQGVGTLHLGKWRRMNVDLKSLMWPSPLVLKVWHHVGLVARVHTFFK